MCHNVYAEGFISTICEPNVKESDFYNKHLLMSPDVKNFNVTNYSVQVIESDNLNLYGLYVGFSSESFGSKPPLTTQPGRYAITPIL